METVTANSEQEKPPFIDKQIEGYVFGLRRFICGACNRRITEFRGGHLHDIEACRSNPQTPFAVTQEIKDTIGEWLSKQQ